jgi:hypothetical protein
MYFWKMYWYWLTSSLTQLMFRPSRLLHTCSQPTSLIYPRTQPLDISVISRYSTPFIDPTYYSRITFVLVTGDCSSATFAGPTGYNL